MSGGQAPEDSPVNWTNLNPEIGSSGMREAGKTMKILVINPNTSKLVTEKVANKIRQIARPDVQADVIQIEHGPESLESYYDESLATPYTIQAVKKANEDGYDAIILAAFCDPGLEELKDISSVPV